MVCLPPALFISLAIQESPPYSRQRRYKAKKAKAKRKHHCLFFFFFSCRCCYSCKQKSRHPIILVRKRGRETGPSPASQPPPLQKKKKQNLARISSIKSMDCCKSTPLQPTGTYSLTHSPMFGIPETLPYSETLFFLSCFLFLSFCPALPPPIRNSASQDPLRACVSCLSVCLVSFSPPGRTTILFHSFSRYRHQFITKPTVS